MLTNQAHPIKLYINILNPRTKSAHTHVFLINQSDMQCVKLERQRYKKITNKRQMHLTNVNNPLNDNNAQ